MPRTFPLKMVVAGRALGTRLLEMPWKTCPLCTPESSKNLILLSICNSITFTLAWVIVSLFKYYAYFSCNHDQFSASPYVIAIVNLRNCVRPIVVFSKCKKILFHP